MIEVKTDTFGLEDLIARLKGSDGELAKGLPRRKTEGNASRGAFLDE